MSMIGSGSRSWKVRKHNFSYDSFHANEGAPKVQTDSTAKRRHAIAHAAGQDAGNASMKAAGRIAWNADDWNAATAVEIKLLKVEG
jgi:hypothetical protein